MHIDPDKKLISTSVREFISGLSGSTHGYSAVPLYLRGQTGQELHQRYQDRIKKIKSSSETKVSIEKFIEYSKNVSNWVIELSGRVDCLIETPSMITIEEIKSVNSIQKFSLHTPVAEAYIRQLELYAYYFQQNNPKKEIICHLILMEIGTEDIQIVEVNLRDMDSYFLDQTALILNQWEEISAYRQAKRQAADTIVFPFEDYRPHQKEIIDKTTESLENRHFFLLQAPTGLGKTIGTLVPSLQYTLLHNYRLFVVTSKTTQQHIYSETLNLMANQGGKFNSIIITAKEKMCLNDEYICEPNFCPFIANYLKVDIEALCDEMLKIPVLEMEAIQEFARKKKVCPFELALDCSLGCDVIVGDFNYVFNPQVRLQRYFEDTYDDCIVIIDEAHNLPDRARDYYSPELTTEEVIKVRNFLQNQPLSRSLRSHAFKILQNLQKFITSYDHPMFSSQNKTSFQSVYRVKVATKTLNRYLKMCEKFVIEYSKYLKNKTGIPPLPTDEFINFVKSLNFFVKILKERDQPEFSELYYPRDQQLKIFCKSASQKLAKTMKGFYMVIAQSATLFPIDYYQKMLGFPSNTITSEYPSPFPAENRLYLTYPEVSTRYRDRSASYAKIAQVIYEASEAHIGNYLAFFPSFRYMQSVLTELKKLKPSLQLLIQESNMSERDRARYLKKLKNPKRKILLLGVHGGIFSEGVDYEGDMAIGIFIVSPGLPRYCLEQELIKAYFEDQYHKGFEYAYRNPGLTRIIQAAGRIFRSKYDKGFVILIGQRFSVPYYVNTLPSDWQLIETTNIRKEVVKFWQTNLFPRSFLE